MSGDPMARRSDSESDTPSASSLAQMSASASAPWWGRSSGQLSALMLELASGQESAGW